jgi:chitosanase
MELVSSAENSSLDWRAQYKYIEDIHDGRGYTGGIIGFCSGTGDMLEVAQRYTALEPGNVLAKYLSALKADNGSATHNGLDTNATRSTSPRRSPRPKPTASAHSASSSTTTPW